MFIYIQDNKGRKQTFKYTPESPAETYSQTINYVHRALRDDGAILDRVLLLVYDADVAKH